jgi:hypothetical protein
MEYKNGTNWCYDGCWMPLTWLGVQERIQHIASKDDRVEELRLCYGLDHKGLAEIQTADGVSTRNLPIGAFSDNYKRRHCKWFRLAPPGHEMSEKRGRVHEDAAQAHVGHRCCISSNGRCDSSGVIWAIKLRLHWATCFVVVVGVS